MPTNLFLVDTSVWLLALKKDFIPAVKDRIDHLLKENAIITTGIIKLELLGGTKTQGEFHRLRTRLDAIDALETDTSLWDKACELAFTLRRKGVTVPYTDIVIAACSLRVNAAVVHADAHFEAMSKHVNLQTESFLPALSRARQR